MFPPLQFMLKSKFSNQYPSLLSIRSVMAQQCTTQQLANLRKASYLEFSTVLGQSLPISAWFLLFEFDFSALRARPAFSPLDNFSSSDLAHQYHWCTGFGTQWRLEHLHQAISRSNDELFASLDHGEVLASRN